MLGVSGWLGWHLVYRHRVGVIEEVRREDRIRRIS
jgi:hypothetical protein